VTVELTEEQTPFVTVHTNVLIPILRPFICEEGLLAETMTDVPVATVHSPLPTVGEIAAKFMLAAQTV